MEALGSGLSIMKARYLGDTFSVKGFEVSTRVQLYSCIDDWCYVERFLRSSKEVLSFLVLSKISWLKV